MAANAAPHIQSLNYIVKQTLENNPQALEKLANLQASQSARSAAQGGYFPNVDFRFAAGPNEAYDSETDDDFNHYVGNRADLIVVQPVFSGLSTYNLVKERNYQIQVARYNEAYIEEQLALAASTAYMDVLRTYQLQELAIKNVKIHEKTLVAVKSLYHGGAGKKPDVDLAIGRLSQSKALSHNFEKLHQDAIADFVSIVGFRPGHLRVPVLPRSPRHMTAAQKIALEYHPALLSAKQVARAAHAAVGVSASKLYPTVNIEASANNSYEIGAVGRDQDRRAMVAMNYNLFHGGSDQAEIAKARQDYIASWQRERYIEREVNKNVSTVWDALTADNKRVGELLEHVKASKRVLEGYKDQFVMGRRSLLDVLNTENELFSSNVAYLNGQYAVRTDTYGLLASMGTLVHSFVR